MKSFIMSVGNPIAFFVVLFSHVPGTFNKFSGNMFQMTLFGLVVLAALGYVYLVICAILRMAIKRNGTLLDYIGQISATMFRLSVIGLIAPFLLLFEEVEGNVFGFLIFPPVVVLSLIWIVVSLYAICKRESGIDSRLVNK